MKTLVIACKVKKGVKLDFTKLKLLKHYVGIDKLELSGIYKVESLERVTLTNYLQPDFTEWSGENLEHITIDGSSFLESLDGIQKMKNLKLIEINNCKKLKRPTLYTNEYPYLRIYIDGVLQD